MLLLLWYILRGLSSSKGLIRGLSSTVQEKKANRKEIKTKRKKNIKKKEKKKYLSEDRRRKSQNRQEEGKKDAPVQDWKLKTWRKLVCFVERVKKRSEGRNTATLRYGSGRKSVPETNRKTEKGWQMSTRRCKWKPKRVRRSKDYFCSAWTVAGRSSDSDGGPWPLYRMYRRHRQWTLLLHASVGRLHSESTSGPGCPRCERTMALATFSCAFLSDFRDPADATHHTALQYSMRGRINAT